MTTPTHPALSDVAHSHAGAQVALVDDDPQILEALSDWLRMMGMTPRPFTSAESLLEDLQSPESPQRGALAGAILDINLGGMHGVALAHQLRASFPDLPLVMISALNTQEISQLGDLPVKSTYLQKPFHLDALEDALFGWIH